MDKRLINLPKITGFTEKEKDIYREAILRFEKATENGDLYFYDKSLKFDFVKPTDEAIIQDIADKYNKTFEEVDKIVTSIESAIFN